jgi:2-polyprenyl-3-methyl-5-hydroxy-6-metoxy-1,4-benzoquinol methylase
LEVEMTQSVFSAELAPDSAPTEIWRTHFYSEYDPADRADDFDSRYPYLKRLMTQHVPADRNARILDLGCGKGTLLRALQRQGYMNLTGIDASLSQIEAARSRDIGIVKRIDAVSFLRHSRASEFDVIITFDVIEHLTRKELLVLGKELFRVLAPGGRWIVHAPNASGIFGNRVRYADVTHEQAFTPESVRQWSAKLGFVSAKCYEDKPVIHGCKSLVRRVVWELVRTGAALCLVAESGPPGELILSQNLLAILLK